jgi:hypothetical protein
MATNKKIFIIVAFVFIATMIFFTIDIFSRTTRRGSKKHLIESVKPKESFHIPSRRMVSSGQPLAVSGQLYDQALTRKIKGQWSDRR